MFQVSAVVQTSIQTILWCRDRRQIVKMEKLKALRTGNRAAITKTLKKLKECVNSENFYKEESSGIYELLLKKKQLVDDINEKILEAIDAEQTETEVIEQVEYDSDITVEIKRLEKILKKKSVDKQSHEITNDIQHHQSI